MDGEKFDLEQFPISESAVRMMSYVSQGFYDNSYVGKWLYQVMGMEYDDVRKIIEELPYQMFPETATWGLKYHELKWQLPVRDNLSYEERRQFIYQKRDYKAPMTPYRMESYLKSVTKFDVSIADCNDAGQFDYVPAHPNMFKVFVVGEGTFNTKAVKEAINRIKQAHTTYVINDHVDYNIDNSNVEIFEFCKLLIAVNILFWNINKDQKYTQVFKMFVRTHISLLEELPVSNIRIKYSTQLKEIADTKKIKVKANLDSTKLEQLKTREVINIYINNMTEHITNTTVISRNNLIYLDGTVLLNGCRLMNAAIKQEEL